MLSCTGHALTGNDVLTEQKTKMAFLFLLCNVANVSPHVSHIWPPSFVFGTCWHCCVLHFVLIFQMIQMQWSSPIAMLLSIVVVCAILTICNPEDETACVTSGLQPVSKPFPVDSRHTVTNPEVEKE